MPFWRKTKFPGFLGLVSRRYVYVQRRRDRLIDQSTGDALDRRRGLETELLCPGDPTPITLSVFLVLAKRLAGKSISEMTYFVSSGM